MTMTVQVSIIMPVYNAESSLQNTVNSVLRQTMPEWELLCINDGSTDGSLNLLQELAKREPRLRVIDQTNAGVSAARNKGIEQSQGFWLLMLDSDDLLEPDILEKFMDAAQQHPDIDLICCGYDERTPTEENVVRRGGLLSGRNDQGLVTREFAAEYVHAACWAKLYRRAFIQRSGMRFRRDLSIGEDHCFVLTCIMHARKVFILQDELYHYMQCTQGAISRFDAGTLTHDTYVSTVNIYARLVKDMPQEWPARMKKAYSAALLAHYLRVSRWVLSVFKRTRAQEYSAMKRKLIYRVLPLLQGSGLIGSLRMLRRFFR